MFGQGFTFFNNGQAVSRGVPTDTDALAYFTANSTLTDVTTKNAINQFVLDLKSNSLWTLGKYLYLGFLGDSTKVKYNLFAPSSNVLTLSSGWTYDSQGMQGNGTSAFARTSFIANTSASLNSKFIGIYSQTNVDSLSAEIGAFNGGYVDWLLPRYDNSIYGQLSMGSTPYQTTTNIDSRGFISVSRTANNVLKIYKGGTLLATKTQVSTGQPAVEDYLACFNNDGSNAWYSNRKISVYVRMDGLSDTQVSNLKTCIDTMLTTLSITTY